jgi:hypothetical protein
MEKGEKGDKLPDFPFLGLPVSPFPPFSLLHVASTGPIESPSALVNLSA